MSDVIKHIRLNPEKKEEALAIKIIAKAEARGVDFKRLVLPLILELEGFNFESPLDLTRELLVSIEEVRQVAESLKQAGTMQYSPQPKQEPRQEGDNTISEDDALVQSLKNKAKPGRRREG